VLRSTILSRGADGVLHACDGTYLEDGTALAWMLCTGEPLGEASAGNEDAVTCRRCRAIQTAGRIQRQRVLAWGAPELRPSSWPWRLR
jgi:hypothetical protein